jgi:hypothetical protein
VADLARRLAALPEAVRASLLPTEAVAYMALLLIDLNDVEPRVQKAYSQGFHKRYEAIRRAFGLSEDEDWAPGETPAESQALDAELKQTEGRIRAEALSLYAEKTGHPLLKEVAALGRSDPLALEKRRERGRQLLLGSPSHEAVAHQRAKGSIEEPEEEP